MRRGRPGAAVLASAVALVLLAACGGGEERVSKERMCDEAMADFDAVGPPPMSPDLAAAACADRERLTGEEFATQGNAICRETNEALEALGERGSGEDLAAFAALLAQIREQELESFAALAALGPPEGLEGAADRALALLEQASVLAREVAEAAAAGDEAGAAALQGEIEAVQPELESVARDLGLDECVVEAQA